MNSRVSMPPRSMLFIYLIICLLSGCVQKPHESGSSEILISEESLPLYEQFPHVALLIKFPTRSRPEKFFQTLDVYYAKLSQQASVHFVISCDLDDETMHCPEAIERLKKYPNLSFYFENNKSKIEACNANMDRHLDFDVVLLASDDMIPRRNGYDKIIMQKMQKYFPDFDGVLHFNDGHQGAALDTLPILGKKFYDHFGYIYHPDYKSFYCDNELMLVAKTLKKYKYIDNVIIEHEHYLWYGGKGLDTLYKKNESFTATDARVFEERKQRGFPL